MNYQEFISHVKKSMETCFGKNRKVSINKVIKNNDVELDALVILAEENSAVPTVYLNEYYEDYKEGRDIEEIIEEIFYIYESHYEQLNFDVEKFKRFSDIKDRIAYRLVNRERNEKFLKDVPYIDFLDLAVVFYYMLDDSNQGNAIAVIHKEHLNMWNITIEEIYSAAMKNTPILLPHSLNSMEEVLNELIHSSNDYYCVEEDDIPVMYVLTNERRFFGAASLLYDGVLKNFAESLKMDIFILPSSVHEVILVPDMGGVEKDGLTAMVREVNDTEVRKSDILSDHAYVYHYEDGTITM